MAKIFNHTWKFMLVWIQTKVEYQIWLLKYVKMVFCFQNCSDLLWEKFVLVTEKNSLRLHTRAICLKKVSTNFEAECSSSSDLKVSKFQKQISLFSFEPKNEQTYFLNSALASRMSQIKKNWRRFIVLIWVYLIQ